MKPSFVVVDGAVGVKRDKTRKFGRHEKKFVLLPYHEQLTCELDARFEHIKHGLVIAVLVNEQRPALRNFIFALKTYVTTYGFRFSRDDHLQIIHLLYLILVRKNQWAEIITYAAKALEDVMQKSYFGYEQLPLDWEPVFALYHGANYGKIEEVDGKGLRNAVYRLKRFYKPSDTPKIWEKIQIYLSPVYSTKEFCDLALLFLPIKMTTEEHKKFGASLWFKTLWQMYEVVERGDKWGKELPNLFATLAYNNPDFMDWTPIYDTIFTRAIRAMGLSIREGKVAAGDPPSASDSLVSLSRVVVATLGGVRGCQSHLERMMKLVEPFMHPSNESSHTLLVLVFLQNVLTETVNRYKEERIKSHKREVPQKYYLTDADLLKFTDTILPSLLYALYTKDGASSKAPPKMVMILCSLCPERVFSKVFEHIYAAIFAVDEPHRLTQTLNCLVELVFLISHDSDPTLKRTQMQKDWISEMERLRPDDSPIAKFSLEKLNQSVDFDMRASLTSFRCHLFYILEMLIDAIDINDVAKAKVAIFNLTLIFYMVPILDYSECIQYHKLTNEEIALCKLSARLPILAEMALDKMLNIIQCLSVTAPKDSSSVIGSFKDLATKDGSEEVVLKKAIDRCVTAIFKNANEMITQKLGKKMLEFVKTNQFEGSLATDMIASMVASMTYTLPTFWKYFAEHVLRNLRIVLTPEMKKSEDLDASASWFVTLASSLLYTTSENYIQYKDMCIEMIDLLVTCKSKVAYSSGALGLFNSVYMLSRVYPENSRYMGEKLNRSLKEWIPIREWSRLYKLEDMKMAWHIPSDRGKAVIIEILNKFLFPVMDQLKIEHVDRETLKRSFSVMNSIFTGGATSFSLPPSPLFHVSSTCLPWFNPNIPNSAVFKLDIQHPTGKNVRLMLVELFEKIMNRAETSHREHTQVLCMICTMLHYIIHTNYLDSSELQSAIEEQTEIFSYLTDPIKKDYPAYVYESAAYVCHMRNATIAATALTDFHLRVIRLLVRLSVNTYAEVRLAAQTELFLVFAEYTAAREAVVDDIVAILMDKKASKEKVRGALIIIRKAKLATHSTPEAKLKIWRALLDMQAIETATLLEVYEEISNQIGSIQKPTLKHYNCKNLVSFCEKMFEKLPKTGEWSKFKNKSSLESTRKMQEEKKAKTKQQTKDLVKMLLMQFSRKDILYARAKLCRTMLWRCQMEKAGVETIKILLLKLVDDDPLYRELSQEELAFWLKKNKVKTNRMDWPCPKRSDDLIELKCGIRPDNMCLAYDSENLPNTEEKWNNMAFFSKQYGCYKWPKTINTVVLASKPQLNRTPLSESEKAIVAAFEDKQIFTKWVLSLLLEKRDLPEVKESTVWMVKYILRSFPDSKIIFNYITGTLRELLKSRQRAEQRLAAEFFVGVVSGTKYRGFKTLNEMWKWLAPAVDQLYDYMNADAYASWFTCVTLVLHRDDSRRYWWLIEQFLKGMSRRAPTAWHQAVRLTALVANQWRETETRRRICEIAWRNLPKAKIETQRLGISNALKNICVILDANLNNDFKDLPKRFHLENVDFWLQRFESNLGETASNRSGQATPQSSKSGAEMQLSASELSAKLSAAAETSSSVMSIDVCQIYLRTLLDFLLQYYEECISSLKPGIVSLFPVLLEYANEDEAESEYTKDVDIKYSASLLVHETMSSLLLTPKFADSFLNVVVQSFYTTYLWRAKVSVLKFIQVLVFSNIYELEKGIRPNKVLRLLFDSIIDPQLEVRTESSRAMFTLILCNYIKVDKELTNKSTPTLHGAILGMGAVVRAHPFSTPPEIKPMLRALCDVTSHNAELQKAATTALREFRRTHRDDWENTAKVLGSDLVYKIENAIAPVYYA
ncbi:hypothetical protein Q1695_004740 [Nippostrongylus brasiliensis]|nr:hypothetical protein Q1695_004740 [Nippostrongylus brasiliensis]